MQQAVGSNTKQVHARGMQQAQRMPKDQKGSKRNTRRQRMWLRGNRQERMHRCLSTKVHTR